jgi:predicted enzyme related to lactoylglutathione lyase
MALKWYGTIVDANDPSALARFWAAALEFEVVFAGENMVAVAPDARTHPGLAFVRAAGEKQGKNRLHLDLLPDDQSAEVARLAALGAAIVDIGQGEVSWVVMADPEGNEFCVLSG